MTAGAYISGLGHLALLVWLVLGGLLSPPEDAVPQIAEVSVISDDDLAALAPAAAPLETDAGESQPAEAPTTRSNAPAPPEPEAPDAGPEAGETPSDPESPPARAPPADPAPALDAPAPAERVAPRPAPPPPPEAETSDQTRQAARPQPETSEAERSSAEAPAPAATEIVPKDEAADSLSAAPRPRERPRRLAARPEQPEPPQAAEDEAPPDPEPAETEPPETGSRAEQSTAIADAVAQATAQREAPDAPGAGTAPAGPPLSRGEREALRVAVESCWVVDPGSEAADVTVTVAFSLDRDGRVRPDTLRALSSKGGDGRAAEAAFQAARRAVQRCGQNGYDLPPEKYDRWRNIEMTFNPEQMRTR